MLRSRLPLSTYFLPAKGWPVCYRFLLHYGWLLLWTIALLQVPQFSAAQSTPVAPIALGTSVQRISIDKASQYWLDDSGKATIEQVAAAQGSPAVFAPRSAAQRHHVDGKALWIRFQTHTTDTQARWYLELDQPTLDDATLYWQSSNGLWASQRTGDMALAHNQWPMQDRVPMFQLPQGSTQPSMYYLRIVHERVSFSAPLSIYRDTELMQVHQKEHFFLGIYFGLLLLVCVVCTTLAVSTRDMSFAYYAVYVLILGLGQASRTGLAAQYLWTGNAWWANAATTFLPSLSAAALLWFMHSAMPLRLLFPRLDSLIVMMALAQLGILLFSLWHPTGLGTQLITLIVMATSVPIAIVAWFGWTRGDASMRWLSLGLLPVSMGAFPLLLRNLDVISISFLTQYGVMLGSAVEMPVLLYGLIIRSSARREGRARAAGLPTRDALTSLYNPRGLLRRMHGALTRAVRFRHQYGLILVELTNYQWFAREHSREMGDRALVLLANRLQYIARDVDAAARIDDNHFIMLIEGPCPAAQAAKVAAKIAASAHRPSDLLPVGASLKLRITCALLPDAKARALGDDDASAQLGWLVHRSEALETDPLKTVRTLNF